MSFGYIPRSLKSWTHTQFNHHKTLPFNSHDKMAALVNRIWSAFSPPQAQKQGGALKFGVLGAANIAWVFFLVLYAHSELTDEGKQSHVADIPAKSHPEVIVQAVAARDRSKAEAFAKSHGIPEVRNSYQGRCCFRHGAIC